MKKIVNQKKALETAKHWIYPALMYSLYDCSDSMHLAEQLENRFNAYVDDTIPIEEFVERHLYKEYIVECGNAVKESGCDDSERLEQFKDENVVSKLPIPYKKIKFDLAVLFDSK